MKTLTLKQPWASLIVNGYKNYEFRSWKTKYRGKILIHSGSGFEKENAKRFELYNLEYEKGAIIGEADLVECILVDEKLENKLLSINPIVYKKSEHPRKYAWKLENVVKYEKPIYIKGHLGLWNYEEKIE